MFDFKEYYDKIANELPNNVRVCEIGVGDGHSAIYLAKRLYELDKGFKLYMVDNLAYGGYLQMKTIYENIIKSGLGELIEFIPKDSVEASKLFNEEYFHFIYLDSSHEYQETKDSIKSWFPKLVSGYTFAGHDYNEYLSVKKAVDEIVPKTFTREPLDETIFDEEKVLNIVDTEKGYGVFEFQKRWYLKLNSESLFENCYKSFLNLDHRKDRLEHMQKELARIGINAKRTIGKLPSDFDLNDAKLQVMKNRTAGAIPCHYGQVEIMKKALSLNKDAFVMEDDLVFCSDWKERIKDVENFLEDRKWDIFFFGGTYHLSDSTWWHKKGHSSDLRECKCELGVDVVKTEDNRFVRTYGCFSTHCYLVNKDFIPQLLEFLETHIHLSMGIDWLMILLQPEINAYAPCPGMVKQYDNVSDIGKGITKFSGFNALGKHWFMDNANGFNYDNFKI